MATAWLATDGAVGLAVVNLSDQPRTVEIRPPWNRLSGLAASETAKSVAGDHPKAVPITIPAANARVIRVGAHSRPAE